MLASGVFAAALILAADAPAAAAPAPAANAVTANAAVATCLRTQAATWDDGISDASTIARVAVIRCNQLIQAATDEQATANGYGGDPVAKQKLRGVLEQVFSGRALMAVLVVRRERRGSSSH